MVHVCDPPLNPDLHPFWQLLASENMMYDAGTLEPCGLTGYFVCLDATLNAMTKHRFMKS